MSCNIPVEKGVRKAADCKCYGAVLRTYKGLVEAGQPTSCALSAAKIVYHHHHPEDTKHAAALTVEGWISAEIGQVH